MARDALLDLARAQPVPGHVDHVVGAPENEVIAVVVAHAPVEARVKHPPRHCLPIRLDEARVVAPHRAHASGRQRSFDGQHALLIRPAVLARDLVDELHVIAIHRLARRPELARQHLHAARHAEDRPARLGLPVIVHDGLADAIGEPACGRLVERLPGQENQPQRGQIVLRQVCRVLLLEHPNGRGRGEELRDLVLLHDAPPDAAVRTNRRALVHDRCNAREQRRVYDVAVADDPADVRRAEHRVARPGAEDVLHRRGECHGVSAGVALHPLGLARGAGRIEHVRRLARFEPFARDESVEMLFAQRRVVDVPTGHARHLGQATIDEQHARRLVPCEFDALVEQRLVRNDLAVARAGVGRDDDLRLRVVDARGEIHRGEAPENDRVDCAKPRACQHGEQRLGHHRHVDQHPLAATHAQRLQRRRHAVHLRRKLVVRIDALLPGLGRDPDQGILRATRRQVAIDGVVAKIGTPAHEPARKRRLVVIEHPREGRLPVDQAGLFLPEGLARVRGDRAGVK